jgi:DNA-binding response OmpR family regulator
LSLSNRPLAGRLILVVEDEPLVALEVDQAMRAAGAKVVSAGHLESGLWTSEHADLSAAVIDLHLGDGSGVTVCRRLRQLGVPFIVYTGYPRMLIEQELPGVPVLPKPARPDQLVAGIARLLD